MGVAEKSRGEHAGSRQCIATSPGKLQLIAPKSLSTSAFLEGGTVGGNGSHSLPMKGDLLLWTCLAASIYHFRVELSIPS